MLEELITNSLAASNRRGDLTLFFLLSFHSLEETERRRGFIAVSLAQLCFSGSADTAFHCGTSQDVTCKM